MQFKRLNRLFRKQVRAQQQQVESLSLATEKSIERNLFRRFSRLKPVRRFVAGWTALMVLLMVGLTAQFQQLSAYYQEVKPVPGGIYAEGIVGSISNVSPIYAASDVDRSLSRLVFSGLLTYDADGKLVPDLAKKYDITENGKLYTFTLKPGLIWHDGAPLTSADVAYTFNTIKDPDTRSPLFASWQNITVEAPDPATVTIRLPTTLASFPYNLTTGIVPQHILGKITATNLRSSDFNTVRPVGAGPFRWRGLQVAGSDPSEREEQVALVPFEAYAGGKPKLSEFIMRVYTSEDSLQQAFATGQLSAAAGLTTVPKNAPGNTEEHSLLLAAGTYVFLKTTQPVLSSVKVRQALVAASNPGDIIKQLGYLTRPVTGPLLSGQLGFNKSTNQKTNDIVTAQRLLMEDGWQTGAGRVLTKNGQPLKFNLVAADTGENRLVTRELKKQWQAVGVQLNVQLVAPSDYGTVLANHDYDSTLHGIAIGADPDVNVYWNSAQADIRSNTRLNLSEWKNPTADAALEGGRTRVDPAVRVVKYAPFLQAWQQDAPALGLYQPRFLYLTRGPVYGLTKHSIAGSADRFNGVADWQIRTARVTN